jgi:hypothetical protein
MPHSHAPEPWNEFLKEVASSLDDLVTLHCMGGFALTMLYGLPRPTFDVDCLAIVPARETTSLQTLAGKGSALHKRFGIYLQPFGIVSVPENYTLRLMPIFPETYCCLTLFGLEAHDLALSKLERTHDPKPTKRSRAQPRGPSAALSKSADRTRACVSIALAPIGCCDPRLLSMLPRT